MSDTQKSMAAPYSYAFFRVATSIINILLISYFGWKITAFFISDEGTYLLLTLWDSLSLFSAWLSDLLPFLWDQ